MNLGLLALDAGRMKAGSSRPVVDIITFVEAAWGLDQRLFPVQRVILKAHYGLPLDDNPYGFDLDTPIPKDHPEYAPELVDRDGFYEARVVISDFRRENWRVYTEAGYFRHLYDTKRCNHPEVLPGVERRELILSIGRRSGKCVLGETLVLTDQGVRRMDSLGDPEGPEVQPLVIGVAQEGEARSKSKYFYNGGVRETRTITTRCGYHLGGTHNHRIKVLSDAVVDWKPLTDLRVGDVVCIHRDTNLWTSEYVDCKPFQKEVHQDIPTKLTEEWGWLMGRSMVDPQCVWGGADLVWVRSLFYALGLGADSSQGVPWSILQSPLPVVQAFLRGLFRSRGTVGEGGTVTLSLVNKRLTQDVQTLLLNLGVVSWVGVDKGVGNGWGLEVQDPHSCAIFADRVLASKTAVDSEGIAEQGYFYDPVKSIEEGQNPVYDLHVPEGESFVANGMTNHNTFISSCIAAYETYKLISKGHPQGYYGLPDSNVIQIISVATDKDQAGLLYREVHGHYVNCFAAGTQIITAAGIKPIGSLAGTKQTLLTAKGAWVEAPIRSFGQQYLYKLVLQRQGIEKVIYTTAEHRWFAKDACQSCQSKGWQEFSTVELRPGKHRLQQVYGRSYQNLVKLSPFGVAHGFTFGAGLTSKGKRHANQVRLFGEKDTHVRPYFSMYPGPDRPEVNALEYTVLPNLFRALPSIGENKAYLLGWLAGYLAAEGTVSCGQVSISSIDLVPVNFVRDVCAILGIGTYAIPESTRESNLTGRPFTMYHIGLQRETLDETLFILPSHREAFLVAGGSEVKRKTHWTVKSVEPTGRKEEVFCATVKGHGTFTLNGNIVTGNCSFFDPYMANATQTFATFQTPQDIDRFGAYAENPKARFSLKVTFRSCVAKGLRGAGNIVVILDEVAHFTDAGQSGAEAVYNAVTPSTSAFSPKDPSDARIPTGPVEGRIVLISSPLGKQGQFYKLFQIGMRGGKASENMLCIEAPTWEVNPTVPASEFAKHYAKDPRVFDTEYGGRFTDRTRGWIEEERDLIACVGPMLRAVRRASPRKPHFAGLDIAQVGDQCGLAIGHVEGDKVVVDNVSWIQAGEGDYEHVSRLDYEDIVDWIHDWSRKFYIVDGIFDQWCGIVFEQAMAKKGLKQFHMVTHTKPLTSAMWKNFKDLMFDERLVLYDHPIPEDQAHCDYIAELLELQEERHSKYVITVEAPQVDGKYDDTSDALNRMIWSASQHLGKSVSFGKHHKDSHSVSGLARKRQLQAAARSMVGGSHPSRQMLKRSRSQRNRLGRDLGLGLKRGGKG